MRRLDFCVYDKCMTNTANTLVITAEELARTAHRNYYQITLDVRGGGTVTRFDSYDPRFECKHGRLLGGWPCGACERG